MRFLPVKKWLHHIHMPNRHSTALQIEHIVHDERFWPLVAVLTFVMLLIVLAIWAGSSTETTFERPFYPHGY